MGGNKCPGSYTAFDKLYFDISAGRDVWQAVLARLVVLIIQVGADRTFLLKMTKRLKTLTAAVDKTQKAVWAS